MHQGVDVEDGHIDFFVNKFEDHVEVQGHVCVEEEVEAADVPKVHEIEEKPCQRGHFKDQENNLDDLTNNAEPVQSCFCHHHFVHIHGPIL